MFSVYHCVFRWSVSSDSFLGEKNITVVVGGGLCVLVDDLSLL